MNMFDGIVRWLFFRGVCVMTIALAALSACSGLGSPGISSGGTASLSNVPLRVSSADFKHVAVWGAKGAAAVAQCPQGFKIVAGGSSSSNGSAVGTGYAKSRLNAWIVKPASNVSAEAFATCASGRLPRSDFQWRSGKPVSGLAGARCRSGYVLVTGFGTGAVKTSWYDGSTNTYWVSGGGTAFASCGVNSVGIAIKHAWNHSQKPKTVYAGCGKGYSVIGGAMGDNAWPGPPIQEHPGVQSGPGIHGFDGWWTFSNALNELTWAACVPT